MFTCVIAYGLFTAKTLYSVICKCPDGVAASGYNLHSHLCKGVLLWNQYTDPIEGENLVKFIHEIYTCNKTKTNMRTKIIQRNDTKCIIYTHHRSDRPIWSLQFMHIDSLGNAHPLKVDRNLQWMSHHPTNPTHNPVLSGTMTHLSAQCQKTALPGHTIQIHTSKRCVLAIWHTVCQHSEKCDYSICGPKCNRPPK